MTSEAKHTPGPWRAIGAGIDAPVFSSTLNNGRRIPFRVAVCKDGDLETVSENSRLIAAAPELLEALKDTLRMLDAARRQLGMYTADNPRIVKARAALAKATGARK